MNIFLIFGFYLITYYYLSDTLIDIFNTAYISLTKNKQ